MITKSPKRHFHSLLRAQGGNVIILTALAAFMLILAVGVAVDMARAQILQTKIHAALDAAGLGASATANTPPAGMAQAAWVTSQAQQFFNANFPTGYLGSAPITISATSPDNYTHINLTATGIQNTVFMNAFGVNTVTVNSASQVLHAPSQGMELVLALDNTGSMNCDVSDPNPPLPCPLTATSKIAVLKQAVASLLNIVYGPDNDTAPNLWVGVVPFSQAVNIGTGHTSWMDPSDPNATADWGPGGQWAGCVTARPVTGTSGENLSDNPPGAPSWETPPYNQTTFDRYYFPTTAANSSGQCTGPAFSNDLTGFNPWKCTPTSGPGAGTASYLSPLDTVNFGPNLFCPQPLTQMTASKSTILAAVNSMVATGDTDLDIGLEWAWRLLSPRWAGLWGGEMNSTGNPTFPQLPLPYNTPNMLKVIILMTDGQPHFSPGNYTAYGFLTASNPAVPGNTYNNAFFSNPAAPLSWWWCNATGTTGNCGSGTPDQIAEANGEMALTDTFYQVCQYIKGGWNPWGEGSNIIIYTIGYGPNGTTLQSVNSSLLQGCASQPSDYFYAPDNLSLNAAFQQIGNQLANLRISK